MQIRVDMEKKSLGEKVVGVGEIGGGVSVILAVVTDFLSPIGGGEYGLYMIISAVFMVVISYLLHVTPFFDKKIETLMPNYWYWPTLSSLLLAIAVMSSSLLLTNEVNNKAGNQKIGYLASQFSLVEGMQQQLHIINESLVVINEKLDTIEINTAETTSEVKKLKKETSDNPRKELANLAVAWTGVAFGEAVLNSDLQVVRLFIRGGMSPHIVDATYDRAVSLLMVLKKPKDTEEMLQLFINSGMNVNAQLDLHYGQTTLLAAALEKSHYKLAKMLIKTGATTAELKGEYKVKLAGINSQIKYRKENGEPPCLLWRTYKKIPKNKVKMAIQRVVTHSMGSVLGGIVDSDGIYPVDKMTYNNICMQMLGQDKSSAKLKANKEEIVFILNLLD